MNSETACGSLSRSEEIRELSKTDTQRHVVGVNPSVLGLEDGWVARLPVKLQKAMEAIFSADFSGVKIHEGPQASRIAASAFAIGEDLYFAPGCFRADTPQGLELLGHELAHVVQQRQRRVIGSTANLTVIHDSELELEADRMGRLAGSQALALDGMASAAPEWRWTEAADLYHSLRSNPHAVIQRNFFIGKKEFSGYKDNLAPLAKQVFPFAATQNIGEVEQTLTRFDFQNRHFNSFIEFLSALNEGILLKKFEDAEPVPTYLHHYWAGGTLSKEAFVNLKSWLIRAQKSGWYQYILTDSVINASFGNTDLALQLEILDASGSVIVDISQLPFESKDAYLTLRKLVVEKKEKSKLPYLSDLARYAQLLALGGVYVDVDVHPGTVDMSSILTCVNGIPQMGPCFRTRKDAEMNGFFDPVEAARVLGMVLMYSKKKLAIGNHFIVAPARNKVVSKANEIATTQVKESEITNGGIDFLKAFCKLDGYGESAIQASLPTWAMDVQWVTPESDSMVD